MTQLAGYWPIRNQVGTAFAQSWTFTQPGGSALNVSGYSWSFVVYDSPETLVVLLPNTTWTFATSGAGSNVETASAAAGFDGGTPMFGYYELVGTPSGSGPAAIQHGPFILEP